MGAACNRSGSSGQPDPHPSLLPSGAHLTRSDLEPDSSPPPKAKLVLAGVTVPVQVKTERNSNLFTIDLVTHDEIFDTEEYVNTSDGFAVKSVAGTEFDPPLPLLKFPLVVGAETLTWSGVLSADVEPHQGTAQVTTSTDSLTVGLSSVPTVRVQVSIVLDSIKVGESAERQLNFWFEPKKGLIKREFGTTSSREPVES